MSRAPEWIEEVRRTRVTRREWKRRNRRWEDAVAHVFIALGLLGLMIYGWAVGP